MRRNSARSPTSHCSLKANPPEPCATGNPKSAAVSFTANCRQRRNKCTILEEVWQPPVLPADEQAYQLLESGKSCNRLTRVGDAPFGLIAEIVTSYEISAHEDFHSIQKPVSISAGGLLWSNCLWRLPSSVCWPQSAFRWRKKCAPGPPTTSASALCHHDRNHRRLPFHPDGGRIYQPSEAVDCGRQDAPCEGRGEHAVRGLFRQNDGVEGHREKRYRLDDVLERQSTQGGQKFPPSNQSGRISARGVITKARDGMRGWGRTRSSVLKISAPK